MPSWPRIPGGLLPTFQRSTQRECQDFTCLFGMAFGFPRPHPTTSSPSSTPQSWRLWAIQLYVSGFPIWDRRFSRASNRRRRRSAPSKRPRSTSGGRSSRPRISRENKSGSRLAFQGSNMMKLPRRTFLQLAAGAAALPAVSRFAWPQAYPMRPGRCIVGYAPGGRRDMVGRLVGEALPARVGQPVVIGNRAGASSNIATEAVIRAPADGYTLLGTDSAAAINAALFDNLNFNFIRDMALVGVSRGPLVVAVHPSLPVKTIPEFI